MYTLELTTLTGEFPLHFAKVNRVHDHDIIGPVFAQKGRRYNSLSGTREKFPDAVRIDVDHVLDLVVHSKGRKKRDSLGS